MALQSLPLQQGAALQGLLVQRVLESAACQGHLLGDMVDQGQEVDPGKHVFMIYDYLLFNNNSTLSNSCGTLF
jgi:hypothetical protein